MSIFVISVSRQKTRQRRTVNAEGAGDFGLALALLHPAQCLAALVSGEGAAATELTALLTGMGEARAGAFPDHLPLELRYTTQHLHHHPAGRRRSVDGLGQRPEACTSLAKPIHDAQKVHEGAGKAVKFPDDDNITRPDGIQKLLEGWAVKPPTRRCVFEYGLGSRCFQGSNLRCRVLAVSFRDAGIPEDQPSNALHLFATSIRNKNTQYHQCFRTCCKNGEFCAMKL